eukprot:1864284-Pyramimonas_sp.AAC.1
MRRRTLAWRQCRSSEQRAVNGVVSADIRAQAARARSRVGALASCLACRADGPRLATAHGRAISREA